MRHAHRRRHLVVTAAALSVAAGVVGAAGAAAAPASHGTIRWAPAATASIHPGVQVTIAQTTCTAGFVLTDGTKVYLAVPASCDGVDAGKANDGCRAATMPVGLPVTVQGAKHRATLAYSSWAWMAGAGVTDTSLCDANDLALVRLDARDIASTNPMVPGGNGPRGVAASSPAMGTQVTAYAAAPAAGLVVSNADGNRTHQASFASSFTTADAGAPVLTGDGKALGMLSVVPQAAPQPADVHDLALELVYLHHTIAGFSRVALANAAP
jgi:hypothetical protein